MTRVLPQQEAATGCWLVSQGHTHCGNRAHWELDSMPSRAGLIGKIQGRGGQWWLGWGELGICLSAQTQQQAKDAMESGRMEARLEVLRQKRVLRVVLRWREQWR